MPLAPDQLDLFAWPAQVDAWRPQPALEAPGRSSVAVDVSALMTPALLRALDGLLDGAVLSSGTNRRLMEEVAQRRLTETIPTLVGICRLHAGFDRARAVPDVIAALEALTAVAAASAASDVLRLAEQNALGPAALAAALRFFAAVRHRPSAASRDCAWCTSMRSCAPMPAFSWPNSVSRTRSDSSASWAPMPILPAVTSATIPPSRSWNNAC
jgi:hypothetical protein